MNDQQFLYESLDEDTKKRYDEKKEFLQIKRKQQKEKRHELDYKIRSWFFSIAGCFMIVGLFLSMYEFIISIICQCSILWPWYNPLAYSMLFALGISLCGMIFSTDF